MARIRILHRIDESSARIDDHFIVVQAFIGQMDRKGLLLTTREVTLKVPVWDVRCLIRSAMKAWRARAQQAQEQAASITKAAE